WLLFGVAQWLGVFHSTAYFASTLFLARTFEERMEKFPILGQFAEMFQGWTFDRQTSGRLASAALAVYWLPVSCFGLIRVGRNLVESWRYIRLFSDGSAASAELRRARKAAAQICLAFNVRVPRI